MKVALLYFSGTGTTAKFAKEIANGFLENNHSIDYIRLKQGISISVDKYDIIGIGSPAYSFRIPRIVSKLLRKINFQFKPFFVFCTSGGMSGNALWNLFRAVHKSAGVCLGWIQGFGSTNLRFWMPRKSDNESQIYGLDELHINQANQFHLKIIERFDFILQNPTKKQFRGWTPRFSINVIIWSLFFTWRWQMALTTGYKRVDKIKCTKCKICETKICPSKAIKIQNNGLPKFNECKCVGCNGCLNLCPEEAILSYLTKKHKQYDLYKDFILK